MIDSRPTDAKANDGHAHPRRDFFRVGRLESHCDNDGLVVTKLNFGLLHTSDIRVSRDGPIRVWRNSGFPVNLQLGRLADLLIEEASRTEEMRSLEPPTRSSQITRVGSIPMSWVRLQ